MGTMTLPPGFRFHPTDDELVGYYLKRRVDNLKIELEVIPVIDLYKFEPWELPEKSFLPKRDLEWFFFVPRDRKYPNGSRTNRATSTGYWKATGKDRKVSCDGGAVCGVRKTLVFYKGRAPGGERTDWVMHEYRLCQDLLHGASNFIGAYALCRVIKRTEAGLLHGDAPAPAKAKSRGSGGGGHQQMMMTTMSKVPSCTSLVTTDDHQLSNGSFTPTNSGSPPRLELDIVGNTFQVQSSSSPPPLYGGAGEVVCDMRTTPLRLPPMCEPAQDAAFFIGDGFPGNAAAGAGEPHSHMHFFGDMAGSGMFLEHELRWPDDTLPACAAGTTGFAGAAAAEPWNPALPNAAALLCRQASDGADDLTAWFSSLDDNMVVY